MKFRLTGVNRCTKKSRSVYTNSHVGRQLKKVDTHVDIHLLLVVDVQLFIWIDRD